MDEQGKKRQLKVWNGGVFDGTRFQAGDQRLIDFDPVRQKFWDPADPSRQAGYYDYVDDVYQRAGYGNAPAHPPDSLLTGMWERAREEVAELQLSFDS